MKIKLQKFKHNNKRTNQALFHHACSKAKEGETQVKFSGAKKNIDNKIYTQIEEDVFNIDGINKELEEPFLKELNAALGDIKSEIDFRDRIPEFVQRVYKNFKIKDDLANELLQCDPELFNQCKNPNFVNAMLINNADDVLTSEHAPLLLAYLALSNETHAHLIANNPQMCLALLENPNSVYFFDLHPDYLCNALQEPEIVQKIRNSDNRQAIFNLLTSIAKDGNEEAKKLVKDLPFIDAYLVKIISSNHNFDSQKKEDWTVDKNNGFIITNDESNGITQENLKWLTEIYHTSAYFKIAIFKGFVSKSDIREENQYFPSKDRSIYTIPRDIMPANITAKCGPFNTFKPMIANPFQRTDESSKSMKVDVAQKKF